MLERTVVCPVCDVGVLWPNGWMDQDASWYRGKPRLRRHCVRWGSSSPKRGQNTPPIFGPCLLWPNGRPSQLLLSTVAISCTRCRVSRPLRSCLTITDTRRRYFQFLPKPELVLTAKYWKRGPYLALKSNRKSGTATSFM